jgi:hypothetical protein
VLLSIAVVTWAVLLVDIRVLLPVHRALCTASHGKSKQAFGTIKILHNSQFLKYNKNYVKKRRGVALIAEIKECVELYLYSLCGPSWPFLARVSFSELYLCKTCCRSAALLAGLRSKNVLVSGVCKVLFADNVVCVAVVLRFLV